MKALKTCKVCGRPRYEKSKMALCLEHKKQYDSEAYQSGKRAGVISRIPDFRRVEKYRNTAKRHGATEEESWWCAMVAERRFAEHGQSSRWLDKLMAEEVKWLRENKHVLDRLDRAMFNPVKDDLEPVDDDGWDENDIA